MTAGDHPSRPVLDGALRVRQGRDLYLAENGFNVEAYDAKWTPLSLFGLRLAVPNTPTHRRAIMWHDIHHVATGYGTDLAGEAEVSAWELRRGLAGLDLYVSTIVIGLAIAGLAFAPLRTWRAWQAAGNSSGNLFARELTEYESTLELDVANLRRSLGVPPQGLAATHRLHSTAPVGVAMS